MTDGFLFCSACERSEEKSDIPEGEENTFSHCAQLLFQCIHCFSFCQLLIAE